MKKIRTVRTAVRAANPLDAQVRRRREFFEPLLVRVSALSSIDATTLPGDMVQEILQYARAHTSDYNLTQLVDASVEEARQVLEGLLSLPHLAAPTLPVARLLQDIRDAESADTEDTEDVVADGLSVLRRYVRKNLSAYLPDLEPGKERVDTAIEKVEEDLEKLFPLENPFYPLFRDSILFPETIKHFLATTTSVDRRAIREFMREHLMDRIHKILVMEGHVIHNPTHWSDFLSKEYMNQFPAKMWRLITWPQMEALRDQIKTSSIPIEGLVDRMLQRDKPSSTTTATTKKTGVAAPFHILRIKNPKEREMEVEIFHRTRPDIPGFLSLLVKPLDDDANKYVGVEVGEDGFYAPTDAFFRDLANDDKTKKQEARRFVLDDATLRVVYQMKDGRTVEQTASLFEKGQKYIREHESDRFVTIPKIIPTFLATPLEMLSRNDFDALRADARDRIARHLNTNSMIIEESIFSHAQPAILNEYVAPEPLTVEEYLQRLFRVIVMIDPRYAFRRISPSLPLRLDLGFYRPEEMAFLSPAMVFPDYPGLSSSLQKEYDRWMSTASDAFCTEYVAVFLHKQYPFLRSFAGLKRGVSTPPKSLFRFELPRAVLKKEILANKEKYQATVRSQMLLVLYQPTVGAEVTPLLLNVVASSILNNQEYLVNGEPLNPAFIEELQRSLNLVRVQHGVLSPQQDADDVHVVVPIIENPDDDLPPLKEDVHLPEFKTRAMHLLDSL